MQEQEPNHEAFPVQHPDQTPAEYLQGGLDAAAEFAVNAVTATTGLDAFEAPKSAVSSESSDVAEADMRTTSNGYEIEHPREKLDIDEFQAMLGEYSLGGDTPQDRVEALKSQPKESFALFLTDLNRRLQGSDDTLVHDEPMKIGDKETVAPEDRYDLFTSIYEKIQHADQAINPARVGDALALTTVMLHPFKDGNGRTARVLGYLYRADFNNPEDVQDFNQLTEPRDEARERGGFVINGYVPRLGEGANQSDPTAIDQYINRVLEEEADNLYTGPYGQAQLRAEEQSG